MRRINEAAAMRHTAALDWLAARLILVGPSIAPRWVIRLDAADERPHHPRRGLYERLPASRAKTVASSNNTRRRHAA